MDPKFLIILTNDSYSDDIRYSEVFDRVPTRQDVIDSFGSISSGDHVSRTYTVWSEGEEVGSITMTESEYDEENDKWSDVEYSWGVLADPPNRRMEVYGPGHPDY